LKNCERILEAPKIIILAKMGVDRIFSMIDDIEEIRYIAYDNTELMMLNSLGQGHICQSFAPFPLTFLLF